ncbi:MAG: DDE-type integrase/transposase/recombinase [Cyclobacteriaceae bacterium]|nr:DDE-type integrase/transposase/recombinase [Cyclobacteriaceae bacterium]
MIVSLKVDSPVSYKGETFLVAADQVNGTNILLKNPISGEVSEVLIADLLPSSPHDHETSRDYRPSESFSEAEHKKATERYEIIKPLLDISGDKQAVLDAAKRHGISKSTLYNWIKRYRSVGNIGVLVDRPGRGGKGGIRINKKVYAIVLKVINKVHLRERKTIETTYKEIQRICRNRKYGVPSINTVRNHINHIKERDRIASQRGPKTAGQLYDSAAGKNFTDVAPLHWVEIDHTLSDIMLVDEKDREVIGKPWITVLIDTYSRMILGFYISFDPPGSYGTGRAIAHGMLRKESWLNSMGLDVTTWPCYGKPTIMRCDNAGEFVGETIKEASGFYGIDFEFRSPGRPQHGAYIERFLGNYATWLKDVRGTTNKSKELKRLYNPEKMANMTLPEFEKWVTMALTIYHNEYHSEIQMAPIAKWHHGLYNEVNGIGNPDVYTDYLRLQLDFSPREKRTIQRTGVKLNNIFYYSEVLNNYINTTDANGKIKYKFKYDPRDISRIYFMEPKQNCYYEIPYADLRGIPMSIWDHRKVVKKIKEQGKKVNQSLIFKTYESMRALEEMAKKTTKEARKRKARETTLKRERQAEEKVPKQVHTGKFFNSTSSEVKSFKTNYGKARLFK